MNCDFKKPLTGTAQVKEKIIIEGKKALATRFQGLTKRDVLLLPAECFFPPRRKTFIAQLNLNREEEKTRGWLGSLKAWLLLINPVLVCVGPSIKEKKNLSPSLSIYVMEGC